MVDGVDDGQYKEDNLYGQHELTGNRLTRNATRIRVVRRGRRAKQPTTDVQTPEENIVACGQRHPVIIILVLQQII